jgi:hypothetical protein
MAIDIFSLQLMHKGDLKSMRGVKKPSFEGFQKMNPKVANL